MSQNDLGLLFFKFKGGLGFSKEFWLKTIVFMNFPGKVISVLSLLYSANNAKSGLEKWITWSYIIFMTLGMYWYSHFWADVSARQLFFENNTKHVLTTVLFQYKYKPFLIICGAFLYYLIYSILFYRSYMQKTVNERLYWLLALFNLFISANLLLLISAFY